MEQAKRECILIEAARAFGRFGFKKASIDAIARAAGVAKGTVYNACESKEDLFYQVLHREVRGWIAETSKAIDPRLPADELLVRLSEHGEAYLDERPLVKELMFGEVHQLLPLWGERLDTLAALGVESVIQVLKLGQSQGIFRKDLDLETVGVLLQDLSLAYHILHDRDVPERSAIIARRRRVALDMILNGIRAESPA